MKLKAIAHHPQQTKQAAQTLDEMLLGDIRPTQGHPS